MGSRHFLCLSPWGEEEFSFSLSWGTFERLSFMVPRGGIQSTSHLSPRGEGCFHVLLPHQGGRRENSQTVGVQWVPDIFCLSLAVVKWTIFVSLPLEECRLGDESLNGGSGCENQATCTSDFSQTAAKPRFGKNTMCTCLIRTGATAVKGRVL